MKWLSAAVVAAVCFCTPAWAQMDMTAQAIMLAVMAMNQPPQVPLDDPCTDCQRLHKVAILSALGSSVPFEGRGKNGKVDLSAWAIDAEMVALLKKHLAGRFEIVDLTVDQAKLAAHSRSRGQMKAFLKTVPNPGVDAYIVVRPVSSAPATEGLSLMTSWTEGNGLVRAMYQIDIYDAKTQSQLGYAESQFRRRENEAPFFPIVEVDNVDKQAVIAGKAPEAMERIHRALTYALQYSCVETLRALGIGATLPPVGDHSIAVPMHAFEMAQYKTIGVVSAIGDDLRVVIGGHMFVDKKNVIVPGVIPGLDSKIESVATAVLAHHYTAKPAMLDRAALAGLEIPLEGQMAPVAGLPANPDVDAYVAFFRAPTSEDPTGQGGTNLLYWIPMGDNTLSLSANIGIAVIDAKTGQVVLSAKLQPGPKLPCPQITRFTIGTSRCPLDPKKFAPTVPTALSEETKAEVLSKLDLILADAVPDTLFRIGMDSDAP